MEKFITRITNAWIQIQESLPKNPRSYPTIVQEIVTISRCCELALAHGPMEPYQSLLLAERMKWEIKKKAMPYPGDPRMSTLSALTSIWSLQKSLQDIEKKTLSEKRKYSVYSEDECEG